VERTSSGIEAVNARAGLRLPKAIGAIVGGVEVEAIAGGGKLNEAGVADGNAWFRLEQDRVGGDNGPIAAYQRPHPLRNGAVNQIGRIDVQQINRGRDDSERRALARNV